MCSRFGTVSDRDKLPDRRTLATAYTALCIASRGKNLINNAACVERFITKFIKTTVRFMRTMYEIRLYLRLRRFTPDLDGGDLQLNIGMGEQEEN